MKSVANSPLHNGKFDYFSRTCAKLWLALIEARLGKWTDCEEALHSVSRLYKKDLYKFCQPDFSQWRAILNKMQQDHPDPAVQSRLEREYEEATSQVH